MGAPCNKAKLFTRSKANRNHLLYDIYFSLVAEKVALPSFI